MHEYFLKIRFFYKQIADIKASDDTCNIVQFALEQKIDVFSRNIQVANPLNFKYVFSIACLTSSLNHL